MIAANQWLCARRWGELAWPARCVSQPTRRSSAARDQHSGSFRGYARHAAAGALVGRGRALEWLLPGDQISPLGGVPSRPRQSRRPGCGRDGGITEAGDGRLQPKRREPCGTSRSREQRSPDDVRRWSVFEATLFGLVASTDDMREGTSAFLEKRKAEFKGR